MPGATLRLGVLCDLLEERWFSMDLLGDMLIENAHVTPNVSVVRVRPKLDGALARWVSSPGESEVARWSRKVGLGAARYVRYPFVLGAELGRCDWFHVVDHSYAHLALRVPEGRSGVYCHDVDAFRPLLESDALRRRALARLVLAGFRRARVVFHSTLAVRDEILAHRLAPAERLVHAPYGVAREFVPDPSPADPELASRSPFLLHVGSLIPRKNPEFLLELIVAICRARPELEFVQIGGSFTPAQRSLLEREGVLGRVRQFESMGRAELAPYYRAARAVLLPSTHEGFGLPVIEALACGTSVVASDIPVLAQVGAKGAVFCPVNDRDAWIGAVTAVLEGRGPDRAARLESVEPYTWSAHARTILETYVALQQGTRP